MLPKFMPNPPARKYRVAAEEDADLLTVQAVVSKIDHPGDDKHTSGVFTFSVKTIDLWALWDIYQVFNRQRMELVFLGQRLDDRCVGQTVDIDLSDLAPIGPMATHEILDVEDLGHLDAIGGIIHTRYVSALRRAGHLGEPFRFDTRCRAGYEFAQARQPQTCHTPHRLFQGVALMPRQGFRVVIWRWFGVFGHDEQFNRTCRCDVAL